MTARSSLGSRGRAAMEPVGVIGSAKRMASGSVASPMQTRTPIPVVSPRAALAVAAKT